MTKFTHNTKLLRVVNWKLIIKNLGKLSWCWTWKNKCRITHLEKNLWRTGYGVDRHCSSGMRSWGHNQELERKKLQELYEKINSMFIRNESRMLQIFRRTTENKIFCVEYAASWEQSALLVFPSLKWYKRTGKQGETGQWGWSKLWSGFCLSST